MSESFLSSSQELAFYRPCDLTTFEASLETVLKHAKALGADAAEASLVHSTSFSMEYRLGKIESVELCESTRWGVRLLVGHRQASVASTDFSPQVCERMIQETLAIARLTPKDPYCGLADPGLLASHVDSQDPLENYDQTVPSPQALKEVVLACEDAALSVPGVQSSEGATASWEKSALLMRASNGFSGRMEDSSFSLWTSVLAKGQGDQQRDAYGHSAVFWQDLESAHHIGQTAGKRAVSRLNPIKMATCSIPVVYDPLISQSLLGHVLGAIKGSEVARKTSFLQDSLGQAIFPSHITIVDDPFRKRGFGSRLFDGEGLPSRKLNVVEAGVLTTWLLNLRASRQLGLVPTGHGALNLGGVPGISCSNFYMCPGQDSVEALLSPIEKGFYVTGLMGFGVNGLTGDYSMGAHGFLIEKGKLTCPVHEVTIAGTLPEMFRGLTPANDLTLRGAVAAPTLRVDHMMVGGAG